MCGVRYVELESKHLQNRHFSTSINDAISHCHLCYRSKLSKPTLGYIKPESNLIFITDTPMGDFVNEKAILFDSRATQMLSNIANNVFKQADFSAISLVKCGKEVPNTNEANICKSYAIEQIKQLQASAIIIFGDLALDVLLGLDSTHKGVVLDFLDKKMITTFSITQLLRNPSLKKSAMEHFLLLKGYLKNL